MLWPTYFQLKETLNNNSLNQMKKRLNEPHLQNELEIAFSKANSLRPPKKLFKDVIKWHMKLYEMKFYCSMLQLCVKWMENTSVNIYCYSFIAETKDPIFVKF